jgi:hypothetical protein
MLEIRRDSKERGCKMSRWTPIKKGDFYFPSKNEELIIYLVVAVVLFLLADMVYINLAEKYNPTISHQPVAYIITPAQQKEIDDKKLTENLT